jgi:hypothetical protein
LPITSVTRSSSVEPLGAATVASQRTAPFSRASAASLPPGKPAKATPPATVTPAGTRMRSDEGARWYTQRRLPSSAPKANTRLSMLRTSTRAPPIAGAASTSLDTRARHRTAPV